MSRSIEIELRENITYRNLVGNNWINVGKINKFIGIDGLDLKIIKKSEQVLATWDEIDGQDDDIIKEKILENVNKFMDHLKNKSYNQQCNIVFGMPHSTIPEMLSDGGDEIKSIRESLKDKYELKFPPYIKIMKYDPSKGIQVHPVNLDTLYSKYTMKSGKLVVEYFGEAVIFMCNFKSHKKIDVNEVTKELILFISKTTDEFNFDSDEDSSDNED